MVNLSAEIKKIVDREFGVMGKFVLKKQCDNLEINPDEIEFKHLPGLSRILSDLISKFDEDRARYVFIEINSLMVRNRPEGGDRDEDEEDFISRLLAEEDGTKTSNEMSIDDIKRLAIKETEADI